MTARERDLWAFTRSRLRYLGEANPYDPTGRPLGIEDIVAMAVDRFGPEAARELRQSLHITVH
ncbi:MULTISPECIES: hypothetical protein [unclassified Bradyrhizobium]|uniref:hypothetical protein n=1 Tax=unclassified Bradyrhizobium TaxID=2631580 RepID=UPI0028E57FD9|nr:MULTISPECIES: hypothetical protein [unclassified Bradyrhizobium]